MTGAGLLGLSDFEAGLAVCPWVGALLDFEAALHGLCLFEGLGAADQTAVAVVDVPADADVLSVGDGLFTVHHGVYLLGLCALLDLEARGPTSGCGFP